jgi:uncharacterized protein (TIGR00369 family)
MDVTAATSRARKTFADGGTMPPALLGLPGDERLAPFLDGSAPLSGIQLLTGVRPVSAANGRAVFEMLIDHKLLDSEGRLPVGMLATLADGALGWAVVATLPAGATCATVGLNLNLIRPVGVGGSVTAEARFVTANDSTALSEVVISDSSGNVLALGTARSVVFGRSRSRSGNSFRATTMPYDGDGLTEEPTGSGTPAHAIRACAVQDLFGIEAVSATRGRAMLTMVADKRIEQTMGAVQGGALALFADRSMVTAVRTTLPPDANVYMADVYLQFARPQQADAAPLNAIAEVRHCGRRLALTSVSIVDEQNAVVAFGTGTAVLNKDVMAD